MAVMDATSIGSRHFVLAARSAALDLQVVNRAGRRLRSAPPVADAQRQRLGDPRRLDAIGLRRQRTVAELHLRFDHGTVRAFAAKEGRTVQGSWNVFHMGRNNTAVIPGREVKTSDAGIP